MKLTKRMRTLRWNDALKLSMLEKLRIQRPVRIKIADVSIVVRSNTSDERVALSCLRLQGSEFQNLDIADVRVIIDAGANIGASAIALSKRFPNAIVIAVEPEASNFALLEANTKNFPNIRTVNAALAAQSGEAEILDRGTGPWGFTITESTTVKSSTGQRVDCVTIPELMAKHHLDRVDILKMDIEGGEKEVFNSSDEWISRIRTIVVELHERICPGCEEAYATATQSFTGRTYCADKHVAYR